MHLIWLLKLIHTCLQVLMFIQVCVYVYIQLFEFDLSFNYYWMYLVPENKRVDLYALWGYSGWGAKAWALSPGGPGHASHDGSDQGQSLPRKCLHPYSSGPLPLLRVQVTHCFLTKRIFVIDQGNNKENCLRKWIFEQEFEI